MWVIESLLGWIHFICRFQPFACGVARRRRHHTNDRMSPAMSEPKRYIPTPTGFLMVLRQSDDVFARLEALMRDEAIPSAVISASVSSGR
jgi:hypothetical protein